MLAVLAVIAGTSCAGAQTPQPFVSGGSTINSLVGAGLGAATWSNDIQCQNAVSCNGSGWDVLNIGHDESGEGDIVYSGSTITVPAFAIPGANGLTCPAQAKYESAAVVRIGNAPAKSPSSDVQSFGSVTYFNQYFPTQSDIEYPDAYPSEPASPDVDYGEVIVTLIADCSAGQGTQAVASYDIAFYEQIASNLFSFSQDVTKDFPKFAPGKAKDDVLNVAVSQTFAEGDYGNIVPTDNFALTDALGESASASATSTATSVQCDTANDPCVPWGNAVVALYRLAPAGAYQNSLNNNIPLLYPMLTTSAWQFNNNNYGDAWDILNWDNDIGPIPVVLVPIGQTWGDYDYLNAGQEDLSAFAMQVGNTYADIGSSCDTMYVTKSSLSNFSVAVDFVGYPIYAETQNGKTLNFCLSDASSSNDAKVLTVGAKKSATQRPIPTSAWHPATPEQAAQVHDDVMATMNWEIRRNEEARKRYNKAFEKSNGGSPLRIPGSAWDRIEKSLGK